MRVLVTGGAGYIGAHVCDALVAAGYQVRIFDDFSNGLNVAPRISKISLKAISPIAPLY